MRIGDKVVDRWYAFNEKTSCKELSGVGKIIGFSKGKRKIKIRFKAGVVVYDLQHFNAYVCKYKRSMCKLEFIPQRMAG